MTRLSVAKSLAVLLPLSALLLTCSGQRATGPGTKPVTGKPAEEPTPGAKIRVEESKEPEREKKEQAMPATSGTALPEAETREVLQRLRPIARQASDVQSFAFRERSLPPPRTGATIQAVFPPPDEVSPPMPKVEAAGPLEVLRAAPEGAVELAPNLSVTFSQPMVAVSSHAETIEKGVPVRVTPEPKGKWRWVGTKTVLFEPQGRFPKATEYKAEVPAGTRSAVGGRLETAKTWTFATPPPRLQAQYPSGGPHKRDPIFFTSFDQAIDADAVLGTIGLEGGGKTYKLRRAKPEEVEADEVAKNFAKGVKKDRWVAFRATEILPADTSFTVTVGPGTPSAEGPRKTTEAQSYTFRTFSPLKVEYRNCEGTRECPPYSGFYIRFNNPLDEAAFDPRRVKISPEPQGFLPEVRYNSLSVRGATKGRTKYELTLPADLTDKFGQTLGADQTLTFSVGSARPSLFAQGGSFLVLDPSGDKSFSVYSVNREELQVKVFAVEPSDWHSYLEYRGMREEIPSDPPGKLRFEKVIRPKGEPDEVVETRIDLREALTDGHGQLIVLVHQKPLPEKQWERQFVYAWVQVTDLALDGFADDADLIAWVTALKDGAPVEGAKISILRDGGSGTSDAQGLARFPLPEDRGNTSRILVARTANDVVMLPENQYSWMRYSSWARSALGESVRWYVFDDRKLYKPKEEVRVKGWARRVDMSRKGSVRGLPENATSLHFEVQDPRGNKIGSGEATVGALGGFDFRFKLPDTANLGNASVSLTLPGVSGASYQHSFQIQEFRRPEFEVKSKTSEGPFFIGGSAEVSVTASYFAGGGLPNAATTWVVKTSEGYFSPPNHGEFTFVGWRPVWSRGPSFPSKSETLQGKTDGMGTHRIRVHFDGVEPPRPTSISAEATIVDVNRQSWSTSSYLLVHPAKHYVGLKTNRYFVERGKPLVVQAIVTDIEGKAIADRPISMRAVRMDYRYEKGSYKDIEVDPQDCRVKSAAEPAECRFDTKEGGTYIITATIQDEEGRRNRTQMTRWVTGGKVPAKRKVEMEEVRLIADKDRYQPGDTAEILVQSPFSPAEALFTLRRSGILETRRFRLDGPTATLKVPILEEYLPNVSAQVDIVGSAPRVNDEGKEVKGAPRRPALASGSVTLAIPPLKRKLALEAKAQDEKLEPGGKTVINVSLKDADGKPVEGEVAVVVVDEAILALTGYRLYDPLPTFYPYRYPATSDVHMRPWVQLVSPEELLKRGASLNLNKDADKGTMTGGAVPPPPPSPSAAPGRPMAMAKMALGKGKNGGGGSAPEPIAVRSDFNPLALFEPSVKTDAEGRAQVPIKLPDNLTRYRVMAVAVAGEKFFGQSESTLTARLPLMVRPSAPRFLNFGDKFELPVVVQNQTDAPMDVKVAVRVSNLALTAGAGRQVTVKANDRVEVRFPASVAEVGTARFQIAAASGRWSDAAEVSLPVWTPATTEAFATYGTLDEGATVQPVRAPKDAIPAFGGVQVSTSSTALQALTDAVLYLVSYPFECSEQLASRILAVAALRDVLAAFKAPGLPPPAEIVAAVDRDLKRLQGMQNGNGGFPFWLRGYPDWPFLTIHVTHALIRAKAKGFQVPEAMLQNALGYLKNIESHIPSEYSESTRRAIIAYSIYVRTVSGDADVAKAKSIYAQIGGDREPPLEGVAWIYPTLASSPEAQSEVESIRRLLKNRVTETAATAHFATSYGDGNYLLLYSDRRVDALLLEGLIQDQPKSDLIAKIVRGLLGHRKRGRWGNTQENAWVLLALDKYFNTYEKITPDYVARAWLGERFAGSHAFRGRTTERYNIEIPMRYVAEAGDKADLVIGKQGEGRLYYRIGMTYALKDLKPPPAEHGFTVERVYEAVDDPKEVRRDADGTWRVKAGARVKVRVTMVAPTRRYHVALVDPLPAGFEPVNADLFGAQAPPPPQPSGGPRGRGPGRGAPMRMMMPFWRYWGPWYEHQNLRDERAEAFTSLLWAGVHTYAYTARATTPGTFVVPPPKAEEMYHPETFGRGPGDKVIVE
jgi:uncharacterized protein YfaS (alpha-2-macroglobulin family)